MSPNQLTRLHLRFLDVSVYEAEEDDGTPNYFNVEELLPDAKFTKWCNNVSFVDKLQVNFKSSTY